MVFIGLNAKNRAPQSPSKHDLGPLGGRRRRAGSHQLWGNQSPFSMAGKIVGLARADPFFALPWADAMQAKVYSIGNDVGVRGDTAQTQHGQSLTTLTSISRDIM